MRKDVRAFLILLVISFVFRGIAGVRAVDTDRNPIHTGRQSNLDSSPAQIKAIVFKEELSIGVADGDEKYMFGSSVVFNVDDQGNIYALDWENKQVKK